MSCYLTEMIIWRSWEIVQTEGKENERLLKWDNQMKIERNPTERRQRNEQQLKWDDQMKTASNLTERLQWCDQLLKRENEERKK